MNPTGHDYGTGFGAARPLALLFAVWLCGPAAVAAGDGAAAGRPAELTPGTMADQGFSIECRFSDHTIKEGARPARRTGVVLVQVIFDAAEGPRVREMNAASLDVREGDEVILSVPLQWAAGDRPGFVQFSIHERMLPNASIVLTNNADNTPSFAIPLQQFRPAP